jgi:hypothetical protein
VRVSEPAGAEAEGRGAKIAAPVGSFWRARRLREEPARA